MKLRKREEKTKN